MRQPRVLVITSCTGEKRYKPKNQLTLEDFKNSARLQKRHEKLAQFLYPAGQMYTGVQHLRVMEGVQLLRQSLGREAIHLAILSAGYGLISEDKTIVPYEVTFNTMKGYEVNEWAKFLGISQAFERAIVGYDLVFILLGENYLRAAFGSPRSGWLRLPVENSSNQTFIFLASHLSANYIPDLAAKTFVLPLSNADAKHYRYGLVGLKGFLFKRFAECVVREEALLQKVYDEPEVFVQIVDTEPVQLELSLGLPEVKLSTKLVKKPKIGKSEDKELIPIPNLDAAPNLHFGMHYFIPEWDDRVDPRYDFLRDAMTPGRDPYEDDIYAHQIYYSPNYNGILVSKGIVERSKKKKIQIEEVGIHKFIRFSGSVMGDCGAFGYIKEEVPPYNTEEILEYYQRIGFDYGVSIDHLIVGSFAESGVREKRYELTISNAEEFIQKHQAGAYKFTPIGAVQGWNPESYAQAVKAYIEMGYEYIGLGGLARTPTQEILEILKAIHPHLTPNTRMHLFGVGRLNAVPVFRHLGVTSFDSASPLRKAWLDSAANYHTIDGKTYAAIRIPKVDGSGVRIKRLLEAGVSDRETLNRLEKNALHTLREFDAGRVSLESTLDVLLALDELLELPRNGKVNPQEKARRLGRHAQMYRELLEEQPWKKCDCVICQEIGIEVVIFRGNDRNRRRGFHNTYIFYKRFNALLKGRRY
ncbi:MAG TPA: queuine/archaeosine tRNA-ribosyltransferase [Cyanobacteria bacterium UBA12227]|nr:queuine/archaeosine tRNA-ribosyltransferase [Cyanobacteria bacterium UBA12227]HAX88327.1 queuine/archaeosine tRNA-ribosyltransferase [Cyanobacteria bacterium UBA11370]HBY81136.1 queuine/archaeosine tRNA-ribosyltransferase [Cyanobacteria bacterium UBA11148]